MWDQIGNGETIGTMGSENGEILIDDEHPAGARLTLEKDGETAPFTITSGVYGCFFHTTFLSSMEEARTELEIMKREISNYFETDTSKEEEHEWINQFVENH